jgi:hypothetical protein
MAISRALLLHEGYHNIILCIQHKYIGSLHEVCFKRTYSQVVITGTGHLSDSHLFGNCNTMWLSEGVEVSEEERVLAGESCCRPR